MKEYYDIQKQHFKAIPGKLKKIFYFDIIRLHKLLEISQYCLMAFFIALIFSTMMNRLMIQDRIRLRSIKTVELIIKISIYTVILAIVARYIPKMVSVIPFIGHWSKKYKANYKGEATYGITVAMGFAFYGVIYNYYAMIEELTYRLFPESQRLTGPATQMCQDSENKYIQAHPSCDTLKQKQVFHSVD